MHQVRHNTSRQQKFTSLIHGTIVEVLRKGKRLDHRLLSSPLTITRVSVTGDLKIAHCYFIPFNTKLTVDELLEVLNYSKYSIRASVTEKIKMKFSPEIFFHFDHAFENVNKLLEQIATINSDR